MLWWERRSKTTFVQFATFFCSLLPPKSWRDGLRQQSVWSPISFGRLSNIKLHVFFLSFCEPYGRIKMSPPTVQIKDARIVSFHFHMCVAHIHGCMVVVWCLVGLGYTLWWGWWSIHWSWHVTIFHVLCRYAIGPLLVLWYAESWDVRLPSTNLFSDWWIG
jgi:hypothetical protein